ncbi:MAG: hypothetical protein ACF8QF_03360 [Phycisphaerales bacterium]
MKTVENEMTYRVGLTTMADFLLASGLAKVDVVDRYIANQERGYNAGSDFYREFRTLVKAAHRAKRTAAAIHDIPNHVASSKRQSYDLLCKGYYRFWAREFQEQAPVWLGGRRLALSLGRLTVSVAPELGFGTSFGKHYVKMYTKNPEPHPSAIETVLHLMQMAFWLDPRSTGAFPSLSFLDVRRGRLFLSTTFDERYEVLVRSEALSFAKMADEAARLRAKRQMIEESNLT